MYVTYISYTYSGVYYVCVCRVSFSPSPVVGICLFIELVIRGGHPCTYNNNKYNITYIHTTRSPSSVSMNILPTLFVVVVVVVVTVAAVVHAHIIIYTSYLLYVSDSERSCVCL